MGLSIWCPMNAAQRLLAGPIREAFFYLHDESICVSCEVHTCPQTPLGRISSHVCKKYRAAPCSFLHEAQEEMQKVPCVCKAGSYVKMDGFANGFGGLLRAELSSKRVTQTTNQNKTITTQMRKQQNAVKALTLQSRTSGSFLFFSGLASPGKHCLLRRM